MSSAYSRAEQGLQLLGATAVEDELQPGVVRTLCDLNAAGIKVRIPLDLNAVLKYVRTLRDLNTAGIKVRNM